MGSEHYARTGRTTTTEQRVTEWDIVDPATGEVKEEARLDVATFDAVTHKPIYLDVTVTEGHTSNEAGRRARAKKDGLAACQAANGKRIRYPAAKNPRGSLVPLAFEAGGRLADGT